MGMVVVGWAGPGHDQHAQSGLPAWQGTLCQQVRAWAACQGQDSAGWNLPHIVRELPRRSSGEGPLSWCL